MNNTENNKPEENRLNDSNQKTDEKPGANRVWINKNLLRSSAKRAQHTSSFITIGI